MESSTVAAGIQGASTQKNLSSAGVILYYNHFSVAVGFFVASYYKIFLALDRMGGLRGWTWKPGH